MTVPRFLLQGDKYLVTRRCSERRFFLKPSARTNNIVRYCLLWAARRYGLEIHALSVMSSHFHVVVTDHHGLLPRFMQEADKLIAKCLNVSYGRWENLWAPGSYNPVRLLTDEAVLDEMVYCSANPVAAGLVRTAKQWPGVITVPEDLGCTLGAARPDEYFDPKGKMPEAVDLELTRPAVFAHLSDEAFAALYRERLDAEEARWFREHEGRFAGRKAVLKMKHTDRATAWERKRGLRPTLAAKDKRARQRGINERKFFLMRYYDALERYLAGAIDVVFPLGTYWYKWHSPARVEGPPHDPG